jgi:hypothetical protein
MSFVAAILTFLVTGLVTALGQGLLFGAVGIHGLFRVEPYRTLASTIRVCLSLLGSRLVQTQNAMSVASATADRKLRASLS